MPVGDGAGTQPQHPRKKALTGLFLLVGAGQLLPRRILRQSLRRKGCGPFLDNLRHIAINAGGFLQLFRNAHFSALRGVLRISARDAQRAQPIDPLPGALFGIQCSLSLVARLRRLDRRL